MGHCRSWNTNFNFLIAVFLTFITSWERLARMKIDCWHFHLCTYHVPVFYIFVWPACATSFSKRITRQRDHVITLVCPRWTAFGWKQVVMGHVHAYYVCRCRLECHHLVIFCAVAIRGMSIAEKHRMVQYAPRIANQHKATDISSFYGTIIIVSLVRQKMQVVLCVTLCAATAMENLIRKAKYIFLLL